MDKAKTVHLIISGKVQGVYFRASCVKVACQFGVKGWVKNIAESRVEIMVSGTDSQIIEFIEWCKHGPSGARVDEVVVVEKQYQPFENFTIHR